jgi:hypothetical protein
MTTPRPDTQRVLPGPTVHVLQRWLLALLVLVIPFMVGWAAVEFIPPLERYGEVLKPILIVGFVVVGIAVNVVGFVTKSRQKAEKAAGYTTSSHGEVELDQLDPRSGQVTRAAGQAYIPTAREASRSASRNDRPATRPPVLRRVDLWAYSAFALPSVIVYVGFTLATVIGLRVSGSATILLVLMPGFLVALVIMTLFARVRTKRLNAAAPGGFVFGFWKSPSFDDAVGQLAPVDTLTREPSVGPRGLSATAAGITLWHNDPFTRLAVLPWTSVRSIQAQAGRHGSPGQFIVLSFTRADTGQIVALPLWNPSAGAVVYPSGPETRWIVERLEALRAGRALL